MILKIFYHHYYINYDVLDHKDFFNKKIKSIYIRLLYQVWFFILLSFGAKMFVL